MIEQQAELRRCQDHAAVDDRWPDELAALQPLGKQAQSRAVIVQNLQIVRRNTRHSTYSLRYATIAYRWHPLSGRTLQVSPHRRGKELTCIYTTERPDFSRELPNWMFDQAYCAGMTLGVPQISLKGLTELAAVLASLGENQSPALTVPTFERKKEGTRAKEPISQSGAICSRTGTPDAAAPSDHRQTGRIAGSISRSPAEGSRRRGDDDEGGR